jgi:hypothetical protein
MVFKFIIGLLIGSSAHAGSLRTNDQQQFLNAQASRNYVKNSGAEKNDLSVTDASSVHTRSTSSPIEGDASHAIDASGSGQVVCFQADDFQTGVLGGSCEASFKYNGDASLYKAYATMAGVTVSDAVNNQLLNISSGSQTFTATFPCGASTTDDPLVCVESTSASAAAIKVDRVRIGEATGIGSVAQATLAGRSSFAATASCLPTRTNTALGDFGTLAACPGPTIEKQVIGSWQTTDADYIQQTINNLPAGEYELIVSVPYYGNTASAPLVYAVTDSTTTSGYTFGQPYGVTGGGPLTIVANFSYSSAGNRTFKLQCSAGSGTCNIDNQTAGRGVSFQLKRYPTSSEIVARLDAPGVGWTAFTPTGSWTTNTTWTGWYQCSINTLRVTAKAATAGAPTSATFGVDLPSGFIIDSTKLDSTANFGVINGQVAINDSSATGYKAYPLYSSTTRVVAAYQNATSGAGALVTQAAPITFGAGDSVSISFSVPVTDASPCPKSPQVLIPGSVFSNSSGIERTERAIVGTTSCTSSPCTIAKQSGSWLTSITRNTTGTYTLNIASGIFSDTPSCVVTASRFGVADSTFVSGPADSSTPSATAYSFKTIDDTGTLRDSGFHIQCQGPR